jgi:hypothetical protein
VERIGVAQLPDDFVQLLLDDMHAKGVLAAKAKAKSRALQEQRKITKATLMIMAREGGYAKARDAAEAWAYTHPQYKQVSDAMVAAIEEEAATANDYNRAEKEWESWRSLNANDRSIR